MLSLLLATTFLFTCDQAERVILNVYQNEYVPTDTQEEIINSVLEVTPPKCSAHFYYQ
jgi:hypothetical protein